MNKIYLIIFFLIFSLCNSQIKNGKIEYGVVAHMPKPQGNNDFIIELTRKASIVDTIVKYNLNFNTKESIFYVIPCIVNGYKSVNDFNSSLMIKSKYYVSDSIYKFYENDYKIGEYTIALEKEAKWTLTQETKMIGGYLCYKATSPFYNFESWFDDNHKLDVTAWYAPKIPVPYGPNGYHGLPGLILELQTLMSTFYIKNISLNITPQPTTDNLSSFKLITVGQRDMLQEKSLSPEMRKFIEDSIREKKEAADKLITK